MTKQTVNNKGSIYKRKDGRWYAQISIDGKRKSKCGTPRECLMWLEEMKSQNKLSEARCNCLTLEQYLKDWLNSKELTLRPRTVFSYRQTTEKHILPALGNICIAELQPVRLREFYIEKLKQGCGARTVQLIHGILHASLRQAVFDGLLVNSPADRVKRPRVEEHEFQILDGDMARQFMSAAMNSPFEALYYLAITTGLREGELLGLKWSDIDYAKNTLFVQRQLQQIEHQGYRLVPPKTRAGKRKVSLGQIGLLYLQKHRQLQDELRQKAGVKWQESGLIFPTTIGTPLDCHRVIREFKRILKSAGLPEMRFHDLRHTSLSLLLENGIPVTTVQRRAGHSKPSVTTDIYGHMITPTQELAASLIESLVTPIDT